MQRTHPPLPVSPLAASCALQNPDGSITYSGFTRELLMEFYQTCKHKPERILFFRDGVSEGQFYQVRGGDAAKGAPGIWSEPSLRLMAL